MFNFYLPFKKNIKGNKSFFFLLLLIIATPSFVTAQWKIANGPYEATLFNISFDAQNPNVLYTAGDGVFRSTNRGETWDAIEPDTSFGSTPEPVIKADPMNTGVVYFGGHGALFKSTDYGDNWKVIGFEIENVNSVEIDPTNTEIIYIGLKHALTDAIWKSTDGGNTWEKKINGIPETNFIQQCRSIKINPLNHNSLITAVFFVGIFKSIDGGNNWIQISNMAAYDVAVTPWDTTLVFAAGSSNLEKSTDAGITWNQVPDIHGQFVEFDTVSKAVYAGLNRSTDEGNTWISLNNPNSQPLYQ